MCGIAGIVSFTQPAHTFASQVRVMQQKLAHRGPDGDGFYQGKHVAFAHTRLALLDAQGGAQPMHSPDGRYVLVYNGELYQRDRLRAELKTHWEFHTHSDAEVLLAAYATWGEQCLARLDGMFSFVVWDTLREEAFAARDLLGVKPFVFFQDSERWAFASEAKALVPLLPRPVRARLEAVLEYFAAPIFSGVEQPAFDGLSYLLPGQQLTVSRAGISQKQWGRYALHDVRFRNDEQLSEELRAALLLSVSETLTADSTVGLLSSGGLDSSLLAACAAAQQFRPPTFTIHYEQQEAFPYEKSLIVLSEDEPFAALVAQEYKLPRTLAHVSRSSLASDLQHLAMHNDALPAWEQELSQHHLFRVARTQCKAVLVGDAADETHYGYHFLLDPFATERPRNILQRFAAPPFRKQVLQDPLAHFDAHYQQLLRAQGYSFDTPLDRTVATTALIVQRWLPRLLHNGDVHSMAHSVEARVPFANQPVLELARQVHPLRALRDGVEKSVLRDAAKGLLIEPLRTRRKSALPKDLLATETIREEARKSVEHQHDLLAALFAMEQLTPLLSPSYPLQEREQALLFRIVCFTHWARHYEVSLA